MVLGEKSTNEEGCPPERGTCTQEGLDAASSGQTLGVVTTAGWLLGAAALAAGITMLVVADDGDEKVALQAWPGGLGLKGSF